MMIKNKIKIILFFDLLNCSSLFVQVDIGTISPNATLEIVSTTDALLIPRVALVNTNIATIPSPTISEMVYNKATTKLIGITDDVDLVFKRVKLSYRSFIQTI